MPSETSMTPIRIGAETWLHHAWLEFLVGTVIGFILLLIDKRDLAEWVWIIGAAQSFGRYAISRMLKEELHAVQQLAKVMDLEMDSASVQFHAMITTYLRIAEPEFRQVKEWAVTEALQKLKRLADSKTSDELATEDFYQWLLPRVEQAASGSKIWAVSMLLDCEWDGSAVEDSFLKENLLAAERGVTIQRVFIVKADPDNLWLQNRGIQAHYAKRSAHLQAKVVTREYLLRHSSLLKGLGDGLIAFDLRVLQMDISTPDGSIRGRVTMDPAEITRVHGLFVGLWQLAREISEVVESKGTAV